MVEKIAITKNERKIITIMRHLSSERKAQMLAFARYLAFETFHTADLNFLDDETSLENTWTEADARWEELLDSEEGQQVLQNLADEALAEMHAGKAKRMVFTEEGRIAPK